MSPLANSKSNVIAFEYKTDGPNALLFYSERKLYVILSQGDFHTLQKKARAASRQVVRMSFAFHCEKRSFQSSGPGTLIQCLPTRYVYIIK